ncbi:MAG: hypothetical protein ACKVZJ_08950 [Phycisphaerales bacterium]
MIVTSRARAVVSAAVLSALAAAPAASGKAFAMTGTGAIPDGTSGTPGSYGLPRTLTVTSDAEGLIERVTLSVTMNHTWMGDVKMELRFTPTGGGGTVVSPVFERLGATTLDPGGHDSNLNGTYVFTLEANNMDSVAAPLGDSTVVPSGLYSALTFDPNNSPDTIAALDAPFRRLSAAGVWELRVFDGTIFDTGTVTAASINIESGTLACLADFNNDGVVSTPDLTFFLGRFGQPCQ